MTSVSSAPLCLENALLTQTDTQAHLTECHMMSAVRQGSGDGEAVAGPADAVLDMSSLLKKRQEM